MGYGYVTMKFTKEDGSADSEIAKKVYRYCTEKFGFFNTLYSVFQEEADAEDDADWCDDWESYGAPFVLEESNGKIETGWQGDGLDIDDSAADVLEEDWIQEVYNEFKPYQMKVQIRQDYSESGYDNNSLARYKVSGEGDQRKLKYCEGCYYTADPDGNDVDDDGNEIDILGTTFFSTNQ